MPQLDDPYLEAFCQTLSAGNSLNKVRVWFQLQRLRFDNHPELIERLIELGGWPLPGVQHRVLIRSGSGSVTDVKVKAA
jgi:hypothetical protein